MVTFKIEVGKAKNDGSRPIYIRVTKDRAYKRIRYFLNASSKDLSPDGEIKNPRLDLALNDTINSYKHKLIDGGIDVIEQSVDKIAEFLTSQPKEDTDEFHLDFIDFGRDYAKKLIAEDRWNTARGYTTALNNFVRYLGTEHIDINDINKALLLGYQQWFEDNKVGDRAWEYYMSNLQSLHNRAKMLYNDEDEEKLNIRLSPFKTIQFKRPAAEKREIEKRALSAEALRYMWDMPKEMLSERAAMARDAFFLSFALCGMNAIDIWKHKQGEDCPQDLIEYYRSKTVGRSGKEAFIRVHVHPFVSEIHQRWYDGNRHTWKFGRYSSAQGFNEALSRGLRELSKSMVDYYDEKWGTNPTKTLRKLEQEEGLTFYAARHSFATIAANDCHVPTEIIDRCLCHTVNSVAANSYIKKDYRFADETVAKVLEFVFGN